MFVRGEISRLRKRFKDSVVLTASTSFLVCLLAALCNGAFVDLWTHGRIAWNQINNLLMAGFIFIDTVGRCYGIFVVQTTKQVGFAKWIYFLEGIFFIIFGTLTAKQWGFTGLFSALILSKIIVSSSYGVYRCKLFFGCNYREIVITWLAPSIRYIVGFAPIAYIIWIALDYLPKDLRLFPICITLMIPGGLLLWLFGLTTELREDIRKLLPKLAGFLPFNKKVSGKLS